MATGQQETEETPVHGGPEGAEERLMAALELIASNQHLLTKYIAGQEKRREAPLGGSAEELVREMSGSVTSVVPYPESGPLGRPITFRTRGVNYVIVYKPRRQIITADGSRMFSQGIHFEFPKGDFTTDNPVIADFLRSRPQFNQDLWEVGNEPGRVPSPDEALDLINAATIELDDQALEKLEAEENQGYKREVVLTAVKRARERVQGASVS